MRNRFFANVQPDSGCFYVIPPLRFPGLIIRPVPLLRPFVSDSPKPFTLAIGSVNPAGKMAPKHFCFIANEATCADMDYILTLVAAIPIPRIGFLSLISNEARIAGNPHVIVI